MNKTKYCNCYTYVVPKIKKASQTQGL